MKNNISLSRLHTNKFNCLYNADRFSESEISGLLAAEASKLFAEKIQIYETDNAVSYNVKINDHLYFAKELKKQKWYREIWYNFFPACRNNFKAGINLLKAGIPTPEPLIAAVLQLNGQKQQILVTDFCADATGLNDLAAHFSGRQRITIIDEIADLLAIFFKKGFYSRHLRAANILITETTKRYKFWFIDLDLLGSSRFRPKSAFINTISRASFEFFEHLTHDEREYWLETCFNAAVRHSIYTDQNMQKTFKEIAVNQIKKRHPTIFK